MWVKDESFLIANTQRYLLLNSSSCLQLSLSCLPCLQLMFKMFNRRSINTVANVLRQGLLSELECPVCMEYMMPPIVFCVNGHNICPSCKPKLAQCPTCRQPFVNIRNVALEKMARQIEYPCVYWRSGCTEKVTLDLKTKHENVCPYNQYSCPLLKVRHLFLNISLLLGGWIV